MWSWEAFSMPDTKRLFDYLTVTFMTETKSVNLLNNFGDQFSTVYALIDWILQAITEFLVFTRWTIFFVVTDKIVRHAYVGTVQLVNFLLKDKKSCNDSSLPSTFECIVSAMANSRIFIALVPAISYAITNL